MAPPCRLNTDHPREFGERLVESLYDHVEIICRLSLTLAQQQHVDEVDQIAQSLAHMAAHLATTGVRMVLYVIANVRQHAVHFIQRTTDVMHAPRRKLKDKGRTKRDNLR
jgi:hypothetical protein